MFKKLFRRGVQRIKEATGLSESSKDPELDQQVAQFNKVEMQMRRVMQAAQHYQTHLHQQTVAGVNLAKELEHFFRLYNSSHASGKNEGRSAAAFSTSSTPSSTSPAVTNPVETSHKAKRKLKLLVRHLELLHCCALQPVQQEFLGEFNEPVSSFLNITVPEIKKNIRRRRNKRRDFDSYRTVAEGMEANGTFVEPHDLAKARFKMRAAEDELHNITKIVKKQIGAVDASSPELAQSLTEVFVGSQIHFHRHALATLEPLAAPFETAPCQAGLAEKASVLREKYKKYGFISTKASLRGESTRNSGSVQRSGRKGGLAAGTSRGGGSASGGGGGGGGTSGGTASSTIATAAGIAAEEERKDCAVVEVVAHGPVKPIISNSTEVMNPFLQFHENLRHQRGSQPSSSSSAGVALMLPPEGQRPDVPPQLTPIKHSNGINNHVFSSASPHPVIPPFSSSASALNAVSTIAVARALFTFQGSDDKELSFTAGDSIEILRKGGSESGDGGWVGDLDVESKGGSRQSTSKKSRKSLLCSVK